MYNYLITDSKIVKAYDDFLTEYSEFKKACEDFADTYDAKPDLCRWTKDIRFNALEFNKGADVDYDIWTKPSSGSKVSRIRTAKPKVANRLKVEQAQIEFDKRINEYLGKFKNDEGQFKTNGCEYFLSLIGVSANSLVSYSFRMIKNKTMLIGKTDFLINEEIAEEILTSKYEVLYHEK